MTTNINDNIPTPDDIEDEQWKDVPGYIGYQASTFGRIRSLNRTISVFRPDLGRYTNAHLKGVILNPDPNSGGYFCVTLNGVSLMHHTVIALTFHGAPDSPKMEVNHKDGNRTNNKPQNLEWVTRSQNHLHAYKVLGRKSVSGAVGKFGADNPTSKMVIGTCIKTGKIITFASGLDAVRLGGFSNTAISNCHTGRSKSHRGYTWQLAEKTY